MICPGCLGCGWRPYFVETVEGEEERAWELCPECRGGDAFPSREGGQASASISPRSSYAIASPVAATSHAQRTTAALEASFRKALWSVTIDLMKRSSLDGCAEAIYGDKVAETS